MFLLSNLYNNKKYFTSEAAVAALEKILYWVYFSILFRSGQGSLAFTAFELKTRIWPIRMLYYFSI